MLSILIEATESGASRAAVEAIRLLQMPSVDGAVKGTKCGEERKPAGVSHVRSLSASRRGRWDSTPQTS